jgi:hypothetical protein
MTYELTVEKTPSYLHVAVSGVIARGAAQSLAREILEAYASDPCPRVLVDVRHLTSAADEFETVHLVSAYPELGSVFPRKTAVVCNDADRPIMDFYQTVAVNRGYSTEVFTSIGDAEKWLLQ